MSLISVNDLTFCYDGSYDNIFEHVSFEIDTDWRLGFVGRNGRGKTTFLNLLLGKYEYRGSIRASVRFTYFPFPVEEPARDTLEVLLAAAEGALEWKLLRELGRMGMDADILYRPFETLSPGERTGRRRAGACAHNGIFQAEPGEHTRAGACAHRERRRRDQGRLGIRAITRCGGPSFAFATVGCRSSCPAL